MKSSLLLYENGLLFIMLSCYFATKLMLFCENAKGMWGKVKGRRCMTVRHVAYHADASTNEGKA